MLVNEGFLRINIRVKFLKTFATAITACSATWLTSVHINQPTNELEKEIILPTIQNFDWSRKW